MTSLCPGTLFSYAGLNKKSTPTPPQITSEELSSRYRRERYNGRPWPHSSPTAGIYDIGFTSTKLILLNYQRKRECKLRGRNDPSMEAEMFPNPDRHSRCSTPVLREKHKKCYDSSSPYYKAPKVGKLEWNNYGMSAEERFRFDDGSMVNPRHHTSCLVPSDPNAFRVGMTHSAGRRSGSPVSLPPNFRSSPLLTHKDLSKGEKQYLYSIAKIYSASQMIKLKQDQYNQLLLKEMEKGLYSDDEYRTYSQYIQLGRNRQYLRTTGQRAKSAPLMRYDSVESRRPGQYPSSVKEDKSDTESLSEPQKEPTKRDQVRPAAAKTRGERGSSTGRRDKGPPRTSISSDQRPARKEVKGQQEPTNQRKEKGSDKEESSDTSESVPSAMDRKIHREGYDRPKSRIGHKPEDSKSSSEHDTASKSDTRSKGETTSTTQPSEQPQPKPQEEEPSEDVQKEDVQKGDEKSEEPKEAESAELPKESEESSEDRESKKSDSGESKTEDKNEDQEYKSEDKDEDGDDKGKEENKDEDKDSGETKGEEETKNKSSVGSEDDVKKKEQKQRRDSTASSEDEIEEVSKVNKDPETLEY